MSNIIKEKDTAIESLKNEVALVLVSF